MKWISFFVAAIFVCMFCGCPPPPETIELCQKADACTSPPVGEWACDAVGASATLSYSPSGPVFDFTVVGTVPNVNTLYVLVYYPDPWPGTGLICLGDPTLSGSAGEISISGTPAIGDLPIASDENFADGAKLWLVPASMVDCTGKVMANWDDCPGIVFEKDILNRVNYTYVP
jgi:hypothetical protein